MKAVLNTTQILSFLLIITFSCKKELSFENRNAIGTLKDPSGLCFSNTAHGTFYNGITPSGDTTYIEVKVNVSKPGSYTIFTDLQNGFKFEGSGTVEHEGINIIKLKSTGTPVDHVPTYFTIRFDTSVCALTINVHDSATLNQNAPQDTVPLYNWQFTDTKRGLTYRGLFEDNYVLSFGAFDVLVLSTKKAQAPGDSAFTINIRLPVGVIETGIYSTDVPPTGIVFRTFSDACVNCAGGGLIPISSGATVTINITDYDPITSTVKGLFSGTTIDWFGEIATVNGAFSAVVK
jgi:hypothetical protein